MKESKELVMVFGSTGLLGRALVQEMTACGYVLKEVPHAILDLARDQGRLKEMVRNVSPSVIINCAGYNRVDDCESQELLAYSLNANAAGAIARAAREVSARFCHISSDYIFSGQKREEYLEDDAPGPLNIYGKSKLKGEILVREAGGDYCIIRTSWLFGPGGMNFIRKVIEKWREGATELKVVDDQVGRPTFSRDLATALRMAIEDGLRGVYNFCNQGETSWFGLAKEVFDIIGDGPKLVPVKAVELRVPAQRPGYSSLSTKKIEQAFNRPVRHHQEAVRDYLKETGIIR
jgi:dTDP-4-dehydrorhamnose reductase